MASHRGLANLSTAVYAISIPANRRAGIPEDVASLVEKLTDDETTLSLVNINPVEERTVIVQGGAYAEHQLVSAVVDDKTLSIDKSAFTVRLAPGAGSRIVLKMKRYANQPTLPISLGTGIDCLCPPSSNYSGP